MKCDVNSIFSDEYFMKQALLQAELACSKQEVPVGAVVVAENRIIARAYNMTEQLNDVTAHAEMQAITMAADILGGKYLVNCTLYVTLEPCAMCASALRWAQLSQLVYGASDEKRGFSIHQPSLLHPKTKVISGVMQDDCSQIIRKFFKNQR